MSEEQVPEVVADVRVSGKREKQMKKVRLGQIRFLR